MRVSKSFSWPDTGILRPAHPKHPSSTPPMTPVMRTLAAHLALSGPVVVGQAARWLAADPAQAPRAASLVEGAIGSGWLQQAIWVPALPECAELIPQPQRLVALNPEAAQRFGLTPTWRWSSHMVCRAAPLAQLLLRFPPPMRDWRPLREEPRSHVMGWLRLAERNALILVLRKTKKPAEEADSAIASIQRAQVALTRRGLSMDRIWIIVPANDSDSPNTRPDSPDPAPEAAALAQEVATAAGVLDKALLTTDARLWDWDTPLSAAFSSWNNAASAWSPLSIAALRNLEPHPADPASPA